MTTDFGKIKGKRLGGAAGKAAQFVADVVASGAPLTAADGLRREIAGDRLTVGAAALACMDWIGSAQSIHGAAAALRSISVGAGRAGR